MSLESQLKRLERLERSLAPSRGGELTDAQRMRRYEDLRDAATRDPASRARFTACNNLLAKAAARRATGEMGGNFKDGYA